MGLGDIAKQTAGMITKGYLLMPTNISSKNAAEGKLLENMISALNGKKMGDLKVGSDELKGYIPVRIQFNPREIAISAMEGQQMVPDDPHGGYLNYYNYPSETEMRFTLIFDQVNINDAFTTPTDVATIGGVKNLIQSMVSSYSVQPQCELLLAAVMNKATRRIGFAYNNILFWGELTNVNVNMTMFNKKGDPIRAKVDLTIRSAEESKELKKRLQKDLKNLSKFYRKTWQEVIGIS